MKKVSKILICILLVVIIGTTMGYFIKNEAYGATYTSYDIDGIDESKYPGYKTAIKKLQASHPNWTFKLCYTGLDWNTVINNEYTGHGGIPKSLIYDTYDGEWICEICGTKKYDLTARWYCASKEAIKYMMDPRNSLTESYVFQFQDLSSSVGDKEAVKKVTEGSFLYNDSYIDAIMTAAEQNNVSPFHIVSRIIQEQGKDGENNPYVKGYEYNGKLVYNLFNIGATGEYGEYESGAQKAYEEGWFSLESSIIGGTKFIKQNYINRGQVSLYFQKYNVVENGNLYNHQYMQNIGAPRSEALITYDSYVKNDIEDSSFEFIIPIYENMPEYASYCPNGSYMGNISTNVKTMNLIESNGHKYINGDIEITEWINDTAYTPKELPKLYLKSEDGTFSKSMYKYYKQGFTYYYDTVVDTLDVTKNYYIEAELTSSRNAGTTEMKIQKVNFEDKTLGNCGTGKIKAEDNLLKFTYAGTINTEMKTMDLIENNGNVYITGTVKIDEIVDGKTYSLNSLPVLQLKSTDGTFSRKIYRYYQGGNIYYYDTKINDLDTTKEYYIEAYIDNENNIATTAQKTQILSFEDKNFGISNENYVRAEDNKIKFNYKGIIKTQLESINMNNNGAGKHYISGNIQLLEVIDGENKIPSTLPSLTLKTIAGYDQKMYIYHSGNGKYYFDTYIEDLDKIEKYYIEAKLTNQNNVASEEEKTKQVELPEKELGKTKEYKVYIKDNMIQFIDVNLYEGTIKTNLSNISMQANNEGRHYIYGNIQISETIEGIEKVPSTLPELLLKTENGYSKKMYIYHSGNGNYYFDTYIEDLNLEEEYYIEARLTNDKNISKESEKIQKVIIKDQELGKIKDKKVVIRDSKLKFTDGDKYIGIIETKLEGIYLNDNGTGKYYISGNIKITEKIENIASVTETLPELSLKSEDGYSKKMYIYHSGNGNYYFDTYIEDLNLDKKYYLEASLTDTKNIAETSEKTQKVSMYSKELGKARERKVVISNNMLQFIELDKYQANIYTKLEGIYLNDNGAGKHYISGNIQIKQIENGKISICSKLPQLLLKGENGYEQKMYIYHSGNGNYYFDTYVEDLDTTQQYYIEASLTDINNNIDESEKTQAITIGNKELGKIRDDSILVSIKNNKLTFDVVNTIKVINIFEENQEEEI